MTKYQIKLEQFEGPLDLLLKLILEEELDIIEISLAQVTGQYIKYLEKVEELMPEELADFLVIATKLLLIKSRTMLPYLKAEDEEEEVNLTAQLKIYKEFYEAAGQMEELIKQKNFTYGRMDLFFSGREPIFSPPKIGGQGLRDFFQEALSRLEPIVRLPKKALSKTISLKEKILHLHQHLERQGQISFKEIMEQNQDKTEMIVTFLAILELVKGQEISVIQNGHFEDILINKI